MKKRTRKTKQVGVRFNSEELAKLESRAASRNMSVSEHIRDLSRRDMEQARQASEAA